MITRTPVLVLVCLTALLVAACQNPRHRPTADPVADMHNTELPLPERVSAVGRAWEESASDPRERAVIRAALKDQVWQATTPLEIRKRSLDLLIADGDANGAAEARRTVRLMLPKEPSRAMMAHLCEIVASRGWTECTSNLVRSYSRVVPDVPDDQRAEAIAIRALHPDRTTESVVFDVFLNPASEDQSAPPPAATAIDWTERTRSDAWDLLGRLDTEGTRRAELITGSGDALDSDPTVSLLRRCRADLRCVPLTGEELRWLRSLGTPEKSENREWWEQARAAVARLSAPQSERLTLRHIEAVRWSAAHQSQWTALSKDELFAELGRRLEVRHHRQRSRDPGGTYRPSSESFREWREKARWGDALAALVIDEAVRSRLVVATLANQADIDRRDQTTEYGGLLEWVEAPPSFRARLFPPRPGQREGDERFVASDDLINASDRALAHYHLHAQRLRNESYAGPSRADVQYAARSGRNCVVVTSVSDATFNVDYYQPDGLVLDLGDVRADGR